VENIYTAYNFSLFAIYQPKLIKVGRNLTKFWQIQKMQSFWDAVYYRGVCGEGWPQASTFTAVAARRFRLDRCIKYSR